MSRRAGSVILILCMLFTLLSGCHASAEPDSRPQDAPEVSVSDLAAAIAAAADDQMDVEKERIDSGDRDRLAAYIEAAYGMDDGEWDDCAVVLAAGAYAYEIAVLRFADDDAAAYGEECLTAYRKQREGAFVGYAPEQAALVSDARVCRRGTYVGLFICEDPDAAAELFSSVLETGVLPETASAAEQEAVSEASADPGASSVPAAEGGSGLAADGAGSASGGDSKTAAEDGSGSAAENGSADPNVSENPASAEGSGREPDGESDAGVSDRTSAPRPEQGEDLSGAGGETSAAEETDAAGETSAAEDPGSIGETSAEEPTSSEPETGSAELSSSEPETGSAGAETFREPTFIEVHWQAPDGDPDPDYPDRILYTPPGREDMSLYDTSAILEAWKDGDPSGLDDYDRAIYESARAILREIIRDGMSDYEKEAVVYAWIVQNVEYDWRQTDVEAVTPRISFTPYGGLVEHTAVCLGTAMSFEVLLDLLGIECRTVVGASSSSTEDHAWNMVRLNGEWYCADPTWDLDRGWEWCFFNVTSDYMAKSDHEWDYASVPEASSTDHGQG